MIDQGSRYAKTATVPTGDEEAAAEAEVERLIELRELPRPTIALEHEVRPGERLDRRAHRYYRDPRDFWRICDAADCLDPFDLLTAGAPVAIPKKR